MTYTTHNWYEQLGSEANKISWLNNLETLYDGSITYLGTLTHSSLYYTTSECDSKYFSASTDGAGSGLVCEKLDGYTADEMINAGTPPGGIAIWSGSELSIPMGWELCDGTKYGDIQSPNLCDRFIVGAGDNYSFGETGGSDIITTTATVAIADHALVNTEVPKHTHPLTDYSGNYVNNGLPSGSTTYFSGVMADVARNTASSGGGLGHNHTAAFTGTAYQDKRPPFYALCYIIKIL